MLPGTLRTQQEDCKWMNELSPGCLHEGYPASTSPRHGPWTPKSPSDSSSSRSFFHGLCCSVIKISLCVGNPAHLMGASTFLPRALGADMLSPLGRGLECVLQNTWDRLYPSIQVPTWCCVFSSCFLWRILSPWVCECLREDSQLTWWPRLSCHTPCPVLHLNLLLQVEENLKDFLCGKIIGVQVWE